MIPDLERPENKPAKAPEYQFLDIFKSYARMIIEVFTRKNFGHRYHNPAVVIFIEVILFAISQLSYRFWPGYERRKISYGFWEAYWTWYVFMAAFLVVSFYHIFSSSTAKRDIEESTKTSYWWGDPQPFFYSLKISKSPSEKLIGVLYEPLLFFILGKILLAYEQKLGMLFIVCSITFFLDTLMKYQNFSEYLDDQRDARIKAKIISKHLIEPLTPPGNVTATPAAGVSRDRNLQSEQRQVKKKEGGNGRVR